MIKIASSVKSAGASHTENIIVFNRDYEMLICDMIYWRSIDRSNIVVGMIIPCPKCGYPIIVKPDQTTLIVREDGKISLNQKVSCPARWKSLDNGIANIDENGKVLTVRCGYTCNGIENNTLRED
jgi:hypothetical protein